MDIAEYVRRQMEWSRVVFGPGRRTEGVLKHIEKEVQEVRRSPTDLEWIDIVILALDGAWRAGYTPEQIADALAYKQAKNMRREWPSPVSEDEPVEHVRGKED